MAADDIINMSVRGLSDSVRRGDVTAEQALRAYRAQMEGWQPRLHAFVHEYDQEPSLLGRSTGAIAGIPYGLKDLFVTKGIPTTAGSAILHGWEPPYDGHHAEVLRREGGTLMGKLAMDEFAMGSTNENVRGEPVRNPWDLERVPGGSSGGSAAAVAANMVAFALGTDTGGSIRQPASHCGIVGLKPTYGRVSRFGMVAFASSLDQAGPMTKDVRDAALILGLIAGPDPRDSTCLNQPVPDYLAACERGVAGRRVGVHRRALDLPGFDEQVRSTFMASLTRLEELGATILDIDLPNFEMAVATYYVLCTAEAASNLARYDGLRYGARVDAESLIATYEATRSAGFGAEVKRRIMLGTFVLRKDSYDAYYGRAQKVRSLIARDYAEAFSKCDVIASPTVPTPAAKIGTLTRDPLAMYLSDVFTIGANLAGIPGISVPSGFVAEVPGGPALPVGLQLLGPPLGEEALLAVAAGFEDAGDYASQRAAMARTLGVAR